MLKALEVGIEKERVFQMMLLHNDSSQEVEVHENKKIDFMRLWDHLERGGSAFITSKDSQELKLLKKGRRKSEPGMKTLTTYFFDHI